MENVQSSMMPRNEVLFQLAQMQVLQENMTTNLHKGIIDAMIENRYRSYYQTINGNDSNPYESEEDKTKEELDAFFASKGEYWRNDNK